MVSNLFQYFSDIKFNFFILKCITETIVFFYSILKGSQQYESPYVLPSSSPPAPPHHHPVYNLLINLEERTWHYFINIANNFILRVFTYPKLFLNKCKNSFFLIKIIQLTIQTHRVGPKLGTFNISLGGPIRIQEDQYGTVCAFQEGQYGTACAFQEGQYGNLFEIECKSE